MSKEGGNKQSRMKEISQRFSHIKNLPSRMRQSSRKHDFPVSVETSTPPQARITPTVLQTSDNPQKHPDTDSESPHVKAAIDQLNQYPKTENTEEEKKAAIRDLEQTSQVPNTPKTEQKLASSDTLDSIGNFLKKESDLNFNTPSIKQLERRINGESPFDLRPSDTIDERFDFDLADLEKIELPKMTIYVRNGYDKKTATEAKNRILETFGIDPKDISTIQKGSEYYLEINTGNSAFIEYTQEHGKVTYSLSRVPGMDTKPIPFPDFNSEEFTKKLEIPDDSEKRKIPASGHVATSPLPSFGERLANFQKLEKISKPGATAFTGRE